MKYFKGQLPYGLAGFLIILFLDIGNTFTKIVNSIGRYEFATITLVMLAIACIYFRLDVSMKLPISSEFDAWMIRGLYTVGLYIVFMMVAFGIGNQIFARNKLLGACIFTIVDLAFLFYRRKVIETRQREKREQKKNQTYTLKDLYEGKLAGYSGEMLVLDEEAVDYDLLHREDLIENIIRTVADCYPNKKLVLSLSGKWGSGKTTVLNIVKKHLQESENILIIDDFDPWNYEDEAALLSGILDTIFKHSQVDYSVSKLRKWKRDLLALIFNAHESTRGVKLSFLNEDKATVSVIRDRINEYMSLSKNRFVFILDNIERLGPEKILFLLKTVADVLNFDNIIYVLSYDPEVLKNMLAQQHYGMEYLKKIVQVEFCIPEFDGEVKRDVLLCCMDNILQVYKTDENQQKLILKHMPLIAEYIQDIRDIKRFLNSIMSSFYFLSKDQGKRLEGQLNIGDYTLLEFIKRENRELYDTIWNNATYFVSKDREMLFGHEFLYKERLEKKNKEIKEFYQKLFENEKYNRYKILLKELFPSVKHYAEDKMNVLNYEFGDDDYEKTIKERRIYSGYFFTMYFTHRMNKNLGNQNTVEEFIRLCNRKDTEKAAEELEKACSTCDIEEQVILFERIQLYTTDLSTEGWETLFDVLYDYAATADEMMLFFRLDPKRRAIYILSLALEKVSDRFFEGFLLYMKNEYSRMQEISEIIWHNKVEGSEEKEIKYNGRAGKVYEELLAMASYVIENELDLYDDLNYREYNIWGWYHAVKRDSSVDIKEAFHHMLTPKNIYRFLWDMTSKSLSGVYGYRLDEDNFKMFCDTEEIEECIWQHVPETSDEKFVWEIYDTFKNETGEDGRTVYRQREVKLRL